MQQLLDEREVAQSLRLSTRTIQKLRQTGRGPAFRKLSRRVLYDPVDVREWLEASKRLSTTPSREATP